MKETDEIISVLKERYPDALCALHYEKDYELMIAVRLSAQCTDARVNLVTPALFARFPTLDAFAEADVAEVETYVHSCGFYKHKARDIVLACQMLRDVYGREDQSGGDKAGGEQRKQYLQAHPCADEHRQCRWYERKCGAEVRLGKDQQCRHRDYPKSQGEPLQSGRRLCPPEDVGDHEYHRRLCDFARLEEPEPALSSVHLLPEGEYRHEQDQRCEKARRGTQVEYLAVVYERKGKVQYKPEQRSCRMHPPGVLQGFDGAGCAGRAYEHDANGGKRDH